ncbi:MAG: alpha/beta hydrolase, partial [Candidatus Aminicenantes bacterium]|nr:alpha/beta hydrolase [Candidatus Aminicenantes bacterium]
RVINVDYPSTEHPIEYLAENVLGEIIERFTTDSGIKIHFVTHSMGGIIVRYYLNHHNLDSLGRVVMLSPPNQGSELVDHLRDTYLYKKKNGPSGQQLGTDKESVPLSLGPVDFELGVITGSLSFNPASSMVLPGPDDGIVSVESAKIEGMTDFIVMPNSHTFIMKSKSVIKQIIHFLENGEFNHPESRKE